MARHAHNTPSTVGRRRHVRAAPGALDRRTAIPAPTTLHLRLPRTEGDGLPLVIDWRDGYATLPGHPALPLTVEWTGVITPGLRRRIERDVDLMIALLDALDAAGVDLEAEEDGCEVEDLRGEPSLGWAADGLLGDHHLACLEREGGDDVDDEEDDPGECNGDLESAMAEDGCEPSDGYDMSGALLTNAAWCPV